MTTNPNKVFPPLPQGFSLPFYYASVNAIWMYYKVNPEQVVPYLKGIAIEPALFDGQALVLLNFRQAFQATGPFSAPSPFQKAEATHPLSLTSISM